LTWDRAIVAASAGDRDGAEALLVDAAPGADVATIAARVETLLANADAQFPLHEDRIRLGTLLVLLLQVGGGTLAMAGLIHAFRSSRAEAAGRAAAVSSA